MRGVGQTQNLIDNLPDDRCMIIASNHNIVRDIKTRVEESRGNDFAKRIKFLVIETHEDTRKMLGYSNPVYFDHSFFDLSEIEIAKEALSLAHGASMVYHHQKGKNR